MALDLFCPGLAAQSPASNWCCPIASSVIELRTLLAEVHERFREASLCYGQGTENAWDEATALVLGVTGLPDAPSSLDVRLDGKTTAGIRRLARRRVDERQPLAWLLGKTQYCGTWFAVDPGIVVPRSPIGPMLQDGLRPWLARSPRRILDLCCGSGCLGLLAAEQFLAAKVTLVDADPRAASLARRNAAALGLAGRTEVVCADLFEGIPLGAFDLILCNPPYVDAADLRTLPPEFAREPALGLAGGEDGLDVVRRVIDQAGTHLAEGGLLVCEVGMNAWRVNRTWPRLPFIWPDTPAGGADVFLLDAEALHSHTSAIAS
ncbi:MAG: 50S ribosomal protein L3 N(5)-glutamine methyltransferase [Gammaproteobacteria bacterium]|nr:50S ribosomal protein L3 N(5)-glutamine methyltransferase [Gammaproteobacteria bacterium]MYE51607.1 50S ribosomal protein L3 N(5)-glutamine methyltransferase [Gammaproteobacteria bacterium]MYF48735.1 50S ribosomal protein L3 N(5)-glutamine methyltransferase [Gammaproteobacteria bacterium]